MLYGHGYLCRGNRLEFRLCRSRLRLGCGRLSYGEGASALLALEAGALRLNPLLGYVIAGLALWTGYLHDCENVLFVVIVLIPSTCDKLIVLRNYVNRRRGFVVILHGLEAGLYVVEPSEAIAV